jgi:para-aminobenzoate synthetase/4-amino-4-deoxychorismate lyase
MKGTARRGRWLEEDDLQIAALKASSKERAENLMIVDLLRNDLGKIAEIGTVRVDSLFDVETYPTLHQLTSTVTAKVRRGVNIAEILAALFPCGSVTGAPKRRSMAIISELEKTPRGVYCGAIGYIAPGGEALFSVAIRTLLFDKEMHKLSLGIGSGITTDSKPGQEYQECLAKSGFLFQPDEEFGLIESLKLENGSYPLLKRHLERLHSSALFLGFAVQLEVVKDSLERSAVDRVGEHKVRLLLSRNGEFSLTTEPLTMSTSPLKFAISRHSVASGDTFRYHKTTRRELLDSARKERPDVDEVVFLNERGELTEGSYHNLLLKIGGKMLTPARESGLLAGVMRQELLACGEVFESTLFPADLLKAEEIWLINSVRGVRRAFLVE